MRECPACKVYVEKPFYFRYLVHGSGSGGFNYCGSQSCRTLLEQRFQEEQRQVKISITKKRRLAEQEGRCLFDLTFLHAVECGKSVKAGSRYCEKHAAMRCKRHGRQAIREVISDSFLPGVAMSWVECWECAPDVFKAVGIDGD